MFTLFSVAPDTTWLFQLLWSLWLQECHPSLVFRPFLAAPVQHSLSAPLIHLPLHLGPQGSVFIHVLITSTFSSHLVTLHWFIWVWGLHYQRRPDDFHPHFLPESTSLRLTRLLGWFLGFSSSCVLTGLLMSFPQICSSACIFFPG